MNNRIEQYLALQSQLKADMKEWVKDESIPLKDRWNLFIKSELGNSDDWYMIPDCLDLDLSAMMDDFCLERYSQVDAESFVTSAIKNKEKGEMGYENCTQEALMRYFMITMFVKEFKIDW